MEKRWSWSVKGLLSTRRTPSNLYSIVYSLEWQGNSESNLHVPVILFIPGLYTNNRFHKKGFQKGFL